MRPCVQRLSQHTTCKDILLSSHQMKEKQQNKKIQKQKSAEEQKEEIEALKSIFQDDFEELHAGQEATFKFAITIDASGDKNSSFSSVKLEISFGPFYPKVSPTINVTKLKGLSDVCSSLLCSSPLYIHNIVLSYNSNIILNTPRLQSYQAYQSRHHNTSST